MSNTIDFLSRLFNKYCNSENIDIEEMPSISTRDLYNAICIANIDDSAKGAVIYALLNKNEEMIKALYEALIVNKSHSIREFTAKLLIEKKTDKSKNLIIYLIMQGSLLYRRQLLELLGEIANKEDRQIENLFRRFLRYGDQNTVEGAIKGASHWGNERLVDQIIECLHKHTSENVRLAATKALGRFKNQGKVISMLQELADNDLYESVRYEAIKIVE